MAGQCAQIATSHQVFAELLHIAHQDPALNVESFVLQVWPEDGYEFKRGDVFGNHIEVSKNPSWRHLLGKNFSQTSEKRSPGSNLQRGVSRSNLFEDSSFLAGLQVVSL